MWTPAQSRAIAQALATCAKHEGRLMTLEDVSKHSPAIAERVEELRVRCEQLKQVAQTMVAAENASK